MANVFHVKTMCSNCPFRRGQSYLRRKRARELARNMASPHGGEFACHKTVKHDDEGEWSNRPESLHCIGAMAFAYNMGNATQFMRIMGRLGGIDDALVMSLQSEAYKTVAAMVNGHAASEAR